MAWGKDWGIGGDSTGRGPCTTVTEGTRGGGRLSAERSTIARCSEGRINRGGAGSRSGLMALFAGGAVGAAASGIWVRGRGSGGRALCRGGGAGTRRALAASDSSAIGARQSDGSALSFIIQAAF